MDCIEKLIRLIPSMYEQGTRIMADVDDANGLAAAVKRGESSIEVVGDLAKKIIKIKATGPVAWAIASATIVIAGTAAFATLKAGKSPPVIAVGAVASFIPAAGAVSILGPSTALAAISLVIAAGGIGPLSAIRSQYEIADQSEGRVLLRKL